MATDARLTQYGVEVFDTTTDPPVRLTQYGTEVFTAGDTNVPTNLTQYGVETFGLNADPPINLTQYGIEVFVKMNLPYLPGAGLYQLVFDRTKDTVYLTNDAGNPPVSTSSDVAIFNPYIETGIIGDK